MSTRKPSAAELEGARFWKSSFSGANNECVEVAHVRVWASVRDSKDVAAGHMTVPAAAFSAFVGAVRIGEL
ncbi:DUF397 domain-containing protein [Streptomyces sp. NPDC006530]|uniref:DUF397 domain-containing protein n=1 Tax=Streptomyces sp. NPDC006530 TaxID=3364750 RepID=UPI0036C364BD